MSQDVSVKYQIWPMRLFEFFWSRPQPLSHAAVSHRLSARDLSHSESLSKASSQFYVQDLNRLFFCKQAGFGEAWCETAHSHSCRGRRLKISITTWNLLGVKSCTWRERDGSEKCTNTYFSGCYWASRIICLLHHVIVSSGIPPLHSAWRC